jgi:hypothetical protein
MRAALTGFLRPGVRLLILIVTDEDDCSAPGLLPFPVDPAAAASDDPALSGRCREADARGALTPVAEYVDLVGRAEDAAQVSVVTALPAPRLERFVTGLGPNGQIQDLSAPPEEALRSTLGFLVGKEFTCLPAGFVDDGGGPQCVVEERPPDGSPSVLPYCNGRNQPCWSGPPDTGCPSGARLETDHGHCLPAPGTTLQVRCAIR